MLNRTYIRTEIIGKFNLLCSNDYRNLAEDLKSVQNLKSAFEQMELDVLSSLPDENDFENLLTIAKQNFKSKIAAIQEGIESLKKKLFEDYNNKIKKIQGDKKEELELKLFNKYMETNQKLTKLRDNLNSYSKTIVGMLPEDPFFKDLVKKVANKTEFTEQDKSNAKRSYQDSQKALELHLKTITTLRGFRESKVTAKLAAFKTFSKVLKDEEPLIYFKEVLLKKVEDLIYQEIKNTPSEDRSIKISRINERCKDYSRVVSGDDQCVSYLKKYIEESQREIDLLNREEEEKSLVQKASKQLFGPQGTQGITIEECKNSDVVELEKKLRLDKSDSILKKEMRRQLDVLWQQVIKYKLGRLAEALGVQEQYETIEEIADAISEAYQKALEDAYESKGDDVNINIDSFKKLQEKIEKSILGKLDFITQHLNKNVDSSENISKRILGFIPKKLITLFPNITNILKGAKEKPGSLDFSEFDKWLAAEAGWDQQSINTPSLDTPLSSSIFASREFKGGKLTSTITKSDKIASEPIILQDYNPFDTRTYVFSLPSTPNVKTSVDESNDEVNLRELPEKDNLQTPVKDKKNIKTTEEESKESKESKENKESKEKENNEKENENTRRVPKDNLGSNFVRLGLDSHNQSELKYQTCQSQIEEKQEEKINHSNVIPLSKRTKLNIQKRRIDYEKKLDYLLNLKKPQIEKEPSVKQWIALTQEIKKLESQPSASPEQKLRLMTLNLLKENFKEELDKLNRINEEIESEQNKLRAVGVEVSERKEPKNTFEKDNKSNGTGIGKDMLVLMQGISQSSYIIEEKPIAYCAIFWKTISDGLRAISSSLSQSNPFSLLTGQSFFQTQMSNKISASDAKFSPGIKRQNSS